MKYALKDRELQKKLDKLTDGDFSRQLQELDKIDFLLDVIQFAFGEPVEGMLIGAYKPCRFSIRLNKNEIKIEDEKGYDPTQWNDYPDVTPPEGKLMRLEVFSSDSLGQRTHHHAAKFKNGEWVKDCTENTVFIGDFDNVRFRPWGY